MRYVCLLAITATALFAQQDGASIYKEHCASCHDEGKGRAPSLSALKAMTGEALYLALTNGAMKTQAQGLSTGQIFALLGYIGPAPAKAAPVKVDRTCPDNAPAFSMRAGAPEWNGWSTSPANTRFEDARAAGLTAADVPKLKLKWAFNLGDVKIARTQPTIVGGRVFLASQTGVVYSIDASTGCTYWGFKADSGPRGGVTAGEANHSPAVFFSDSGANVYALDANSGKQLWRIHPVDHFATVATAAPRFYKGVVYQGFASIEEVLAPDAKYECCTFRGSLVAVDASTGNKLWQSFTIPEAPHKVAKSPAGVQQWGPSGAAVWNTPTIDEKLGVLYVATGDNYSDPPSATSDAVLAMDLKTGKLLWSHQMTEADVYNIGCELPEHTNCTRTPPGPDHDFGQPPVLVSLAGGRRELVIAQKSGWAYAIDPDHQGELLWKTRAGVGSSLGGSQWGSASDGEKMYVAIADAGIGTVPDKSQPQGYRMVLDPNKGGGLHALDLATGKILWSSTPIHCAAGRTDCSPAQSAAVSVIPGAVFSGAVDGHLRAYSTDDGKVLLDADTAREFSTVNGKPAHGGSLDVAGAAVVDGMVFVGSGYNQWGGMPGNVLLAYSIDGK